MMLNIKKKSLLLVFSMFVSLAFAQGPEYSDTIRLIRFSADNNFIITAGDDGMVRLWDIKEEVMIREFKHGYQIKKVLIHPSGKMMLTSNEQYSCLWDLETGKAIKCLSDSMIEGFTPDGANIVSVKYGNDGKKYAVFHLISLDTYEKRIITDKIYINPTIKKTDLFFLKNKQGLSTYNIASILKIMDAEKDIPREAQVPLKLDPELIAFASDYKRFVKQGSIYICEGQKNKFSVELEESIKEGKGGSLWFANNNKNIISILNKEATVFETDSGKVIRKIYSDDLLFTISNDLKYIAYSLDGRKLSIRALESDEVVFDYEADGTEEKSAYANFVKGVKYFYQQNYRVSANYFTRAIGKVNDHRIFLYRGRSYLKAGEYDNAIRDFMEDHKLFPSRSSLDLSRAYAAMNNVEMAIQYLKIYFKSPYKERWSLIMKDPFFVAIKNNPEWIDFANQQIISEGEWLAMIAEERMKEENFREALKLINTSLKLEPENPDWYELRAKINCELGNYNEAINDYNRQLELDPEQMVNIYRNIAIVHVRKKDLRTASLLLNEIVQKDRATFHVLLDIAEVELERYNTKEAFRAIDKYIAVVSDDDEAYYIRAHIAEGEEAKADINRAISICKSNKMQVPKKYCDLLNAFK